MSTARQWDDLKPRILTGGALVALGIAVIWLGGAVFTGFVAIVTGIMIWELSRMIAPAKSVEAIVLGVVTAACLWLTWSSDAIFALATIAIPALLGLALLRVHPVLFLVYAIGIMLAGAGLTLFRDVYGVVWLFWLVITVAMTDIAGYFGGRIFGGPKFWPTISPKKTWSGIIAGWVAAVLVSLIFWSITDAGRDIVWIAALLSFASQMGDIAESAVKRKMGVKDSSNLLPGHGGLFDRFDALLGASLFMLIVALVVDVPDLQF